MSTQHIKIKYLINYYLFLKYSKILKSIFLEKTRIIVKSTQSSLRSESKRNQSLLWLTHFRCMVSAEITSVIIHDEIDTVSVFAYIYIYIYVCIYKGWSANNGKNWNQRTVYNFFSFIISILIWLRMKSIGVTSSIQDPSTS